MHTSMVNRHIQRPSFDGMAVGGCRAAHSHALPSSTASWSGSSSSQHSTAACHSWLLFPRCAPWGTPCAGTAAACRPQSPTHSACRRRSQMRCRRLPGRTQCCGCRPAGSGSIRKATYDNGTYPAAGCQPSNSTLQQSLPAASNAHLGLELAQTHKCWNIQPHHIHPHLDTPSNDTLTTLQHSPAT